MRPPLPATVPCWLKPGSIFGLFCGNDVYRAFAYANHSIHASPLSAVMLAETSHASRFGWQPDG